MVGKKEPIKIFEPLGVKGELSEAAMSLLQKYHEAMELYHARKFAEAHAKFSEILQINPVDVVTKQYVVRSDVFSKFPPPADWDGVMEKSTK